MWAHKALRLHKNGICSFMRRRRSEWMWKKKGTFFREEVHKDNLKKGKFLFACLPKMDYFLLCSKSKQPWQQQKQIFRIIILISMKISCRDHHLYADCIWYGPSTKKKVKNYYLFRSRSPTSHVMINWGETRDNMCKIISKLNFMWKSELLWCYFEGDMWLPYACVWVWNFYQGHF